jgi:hypothetical protein
MNLQHGKKGGEFLDNEYFSASQGQFSIKLLDSRYLPEGKYDL